jgi:hydroxysqualene synthase
MGCAMKGPAAIAAADAPRFPETPSGKHAGSENFPVASMLIERRLRPHVMHFYMFARALDDIADNPALEPSDKLFRLNSFEAVLTAEGSSPQGYDKAVALRQSLLETGVSAEHARRLAGAFRQDAVKARYESWDDLMAYCALSADPVGHYLLELHGEGRQAIPASDALCTVLQVLNHLQDCGDDWLRLNRLYLPQDWLTSAGADPADLAGLRLTPPLRIVVDRCLDCCTSLLLRAAALPAALRSRRLAAQSAVTLSVAVQLTDLLKRRDPLAARVGLQKAGYARAAAAGAARAILHLPRAAERSR